jgi:hypothetical protein
VEIIQVDQDVLSPRRDVIFFLLTFAFITVFCQIPGTLYPLKLEVTSPTSGCCSLSIVHSWTQAMEFLFMNLTSFVAHIYPKLVLMLDVLCPTKLINEVSYFNQYQKHVI